MVRELVRLDGRVGRRRYLTVGVGLMALKIAAEALLGRVMTGEWPHPTAYFVPSLRLRNTLLGEHPTPFMMVALAAWSLPFAWVALAMSARRARDAGLRPALALLLTLPVVNQLMILALACIPGAPGEEEEDPFAVGTGGAGWIAALKATFAGAAVCLGLAGLLATGFGRYGAPLFLGAPFLTGAIAGWIYTREAPVAMRSAAWVGAGAQVVTGMLLLLFAAEGVICLLMALPLAIPAGAMGGLIGESLAGPRHTRLSQMMVVPLLALPVMSASQPPEGALRMVETVVVVNAPPERVWDLVIAFPEIPADFERGWLFRAGVATPLRARIDGRGVGAVRHCEFTTGAFVEPITVWDPPRRLAFDVTEQPDPMTELSFWRHVHAPHLESGTLRSERGEFQLEPLADGKTRLRGRTWYRIHMGPEPYWAAWVDSLIHQVHLRVLRHIQVVAEAS